MYAIIETGGKQYRIQEGDVEYIEKLSKEVGDTIKFDKVLSVSKDGKSKFGSPYLEKASVTAKVIKHVKDKKIIVFKFKAKKGYRRKQGHRQPHTKIQIEKINV